MGTETTKRRIAFVDDEPSLLSGLRRMLRVLRKEWDMDFFDSGQALLDAMESVSYDVVVSDMRMPGMDGATLLEHVLDSHPETVRIVLSGQAEIDAAMRTVAVAHQFLSKPCDSDKLREVVQRALNVRDFLADPELIRIITQVGSLPSIPKVYQELVEALGDAQVNARRVSDIVAQDPSIVAKLLQLVNSSFFGIPRRITDLQQVVAMLGLDLVRSLTLGNGVFRVFNPIPKGLSIQKLQAHSTLTAMVAREIVDDEHDPSQAFLAGMLCNVGRLLIAANMTEEFARVADLTRAGQVLYDAEVEVIGLGHAELGASLLGYWGLPYTIVEAVANHHRPARVEPRNFDLGVAVHVADIIAEEAVLKGKITGAGLDRRLLRELGVLGELPKWAQITQRLLDDSWLQAA